LYHHKAPHREWSPDEKHAKLFDDRDVPVPENFFDDYRGRSAAAAEAAMRIARDMTPRDLKGMPPAGLAGKDLALWKYQRYIKDYLRCVAAVDDNVGRVLDYLDREGLTQNTIVVYTSDQGFFLGEHGWYDKRFMYEPSLRVPLIVRAPAAPKGRVVDHLTVNIDIAPTILDYANVTPPESMQGRSLRAIVNGGQQRGWRDSVYYAYYENSWKLAGKGLEDRSDPSFQFFTPHRIGPHRGVRTATHKLIHYYSDGDYWELFDLRKDPNELRNLYGRPEEAAITDLLKNELARLRQQFQDTA
jgi:arylsulfatase A-like enzyme